MNRSVPGSAPIQDFEQREQLLAAVLENSANAVVVFDDRRVMRWHNARFRTMLELPQDLLDQPGGMRIEDLMRFLHARGDYGRRPLAPLLDQYLGYVVRRERARWDRPALRGQRQLRIDFTPLGRGWNMATYVDITELHRHAENLEASVAARTEELRGNLAELERARDAAEAASRAKSAFLATMSHEIRTPLNGVLGASRLLRDSGVTAAQAVQLDRIDTSGRHLLDLLSDLLDLAAIESGRVGLNSEPFTLQPLLDGIETVMVQAAVEKGLTLSFAIQPDAAELSLVGDAPRLRQVLANLVGNAIKFTDRGGVSVTARIAERGPQDATLRFEISDSGPGIAVQDQERVFAPFEQVDATLQRRHQGAGLGLAICRQLVQLMDGQIGLSSTLRQGSVFWFTARFALAATHAGAPRAPAAPGESAQRRLAGGYAGRAVLLVEDNEINAEIAAELLRSAGLQVVSASTGRDAVRSAAERPCDLVLMDLQLPGMSGLDAARAIRAMPAHAATPVVAVTANVSAQDRQQCNDAGMDDFLAKPFLPDALFDCVLRHLERARPTAGRSPAPAATDCPPGRP